MKPRANSKDEYELAEGYYSAQAILADMCRDAIKKKDKKTGQIITVKVRPALRCYHHLTDRSKPNLYCLPGTKKPIDDSQYYGHEWDCANVFVALRRSLGSRLVRWTKPSLDGDWQRDIAAKFKARPDRVFEVEDLPQQVFCVEVDRGTEENVTKEVWPKFEAYMKLAAALGKGERIHVLFTCQKYRYEKEDRERLCKLLPLLERAKAGRMFLLTTQAQFWEDPLGPIFETDRERGLSILDL